jgi:hypothetical protein
LVLGAQPTLIQPVTTVARFVITNRGVRGASAGFPRFINDPFASEISALCNVIWACAANVFLIATPWDTKSIPANRKRNWALFCDLEGRFSVFVIFATIRDYIVMPPTSI